MPQRPWNENYASGQLPWDTGQPEPLLVEFITAKAIEPGRALEIGSGTGTNSIWMAEHGFDVLGVDLSPLAVEKARAKLGGRSLSCRFEALDILAAPPPGGPFQFVFDRGCFHVFDEAEERQRFAAQVAAALAPGGLWLSMIGSTEGAPRDVGPPRRLGNRCHARDRARTGDRRVSLRRVRRPRRKGLALPLAPPHHPGATLHPIRWKNLASVAQPESSLLALHRLVAKAMLVRRKRVG